jgi:hypothetical protein
MNEIKILKERGEVKAELQDEWLIYLVFSLTLEVN